MGRADFQISNRDFFLKSESGFKSDFSRVRVTGFSSCDREVKLTTLTLEKPVSKLFSNFGKKICRTKPTFLYNTSQPRPFFNEPFKSSPS